ncbi:isocitrate lyase/phosphoenolpyruvate mutase family protein [Persicobacter diffluens]|uniref:Isocitrate lyase/phosphoenolpyruvate mutase family protein n=1 Tax=Persicobacter diffluens TaxID=981 RepID=A0AAN4VYH0_9BACT|nr:hypothetical protein PEDI_21160 [Persicobacter diffluens]
MNQKEKALYFQSLHQQQAPLILPNAWHAGSAVIFQKAGFQAIGTTSAGMAYTLGYPDGEKIQLEDILSLTEQIQKRISLPLSVDMEMGYGKCPESIAQNIKKVIEAGAVGINIEDGLPSGQLADLEFQTAVIERLSALKKEMGIPFVINARSCVLWLKIGETEENINIATQRAKAFQKAGADCIFLPGATDYDTVKKLKDQIDAPLNIILNRLSPDLRKLQNLGVNRVSIGSAGVRSVLQNILSFSEEILNNKTEDILANPLDYHATNKLFSIEE